MLISFPTVRTWLISHIVSGLVSNSIAEILGRKKSLLIDCFAYLIGYALYGIGEDATTLCVGRALMGIPLVTTVSSKNNQSFEKNVLNLVNVSRFISWS